MASLTQWILVWVNSRSRCWTRRPGKLWFTVSQRVGNDWETELILILIHRNVWWWSLSSNTLAMWCELTTHWKRLWCWESLRTGEGGNRGWDGWIASPTQLIWVWANSRRQRTEETGALQSILSQRVGHNVTTEQQQCYLEVYIFWRIHVCSMIKIQVVVLYIRVYCVGDSNR